MSSPFGQIQDVGDLKESVASVTSSTSSRTISSTMNPSNGFQRLPSNISDQEIAANSPDTHSIPLHTIHSSNPSTSDEPSREDFDEDPKTLDDAKRIISSLKSKLERAKFDRRHSDEHGGDVHEADFNCDPSHKCYCCYDKCFSPHGLLSKQSMDEYFNSPTWRMLVKRMPWLVLLLLLQSFSASILHSQEDFTKQHAAITAFLPMIVGTGGNSGNQPGVMVTRAVALGNVPVKALFYKEAKIGFWTAFILAITGFVRVLMDYPGLPVEAAAIGVAMFCIVYISVFLGIIFSLGLDKLRFLDPADGAAPTLATISDLIGVSLLVGWAITFLGNN